MLVSSLGRKHFDNFDPSSIAKFEEKKSLSLKVLSEQKLRAIEENAKQMLKVITIQSMHLAPLLKLTFTRGLCR